MRRLVALACLTGAVLLVACGGTTIVHEPSSVSPTTTHSASTVVTATSTAAAVTATASVRPGRCVAAGLRGTFLGQQGAAGHGELGFALTNTGAQPCHTYGYPGVQFLDAAGRPLPTRSIRTLHDLFGTSVLQGFSLAPGAAASFRLGVDHGLSSSRGCATAAALAVIPPDDTTTLRVAIPSGAYQCGTATVSPLRPGTGAYP